MANDLKYSGVDWIANIPVDWEMSRIGATFEHINEKNTDRKETNILSLMKDIGVIPYSEKGAVGNNASEDIERYFLVKPNDIVMNSMNVIIGSVGKSKYKGCLSQVYHVLRIRNSYENHVDYYDYLFATRQFQRKLVGYGNGILEHRMRIPMSKLKVVDLPKPSFHEQQKIASYLDERTTKIDELIRVQEDAIANLFEFQQSLIRKYISDNVFHRDELDSNVYNNFVRLDSLCKIVRGNTAFKKDELKKIGDYVGLQYGKVYKINSVDDSYDFYVDKEFYKESQVVNKGDTIIVSTSETMEDLGHTCYYERDDIGLLGGEQMMLKPDNEEIISKYLYYCAKEFSKKLRVHATGLKVYRYNTGHLKNIFVSLPSVLEQTKIVNLLDKLIPEINQLIQIKKDKIEKLNEYKKSLIYEAVTGKIEVM
jgi:type I restriction enzyme S subunit